MFLKKKTQVDPDSAWKLQNEEQKNNPIYTFVNLQQQGKLIEVYDREGPAATETLIRHELQSFLYNGGKGQVITKLEYVKWKFRKMTVSSVSSIIFSACDSNWCC
jgi:hypothetical protein